MNRQLRLSISPSLPKSNINFSISLKYGYLKSKDTLIDKLRHKQTLEEPPQRKTLVLNRRKGAVSVLDFTDVAEQRLRLPAVVRKHQSCLNVSQQSALMSGTQPFPLTKGQRRKRLYIPPSIARTLHQKASHSRLPSQSQAKSISSLSKLQKNILEEESIERNRSKTRLKKKRKNHTLFEIQPWEIQTQLGCTLTHFRKLQ